MLPKKNRADRGEVEIIFKEGKILNSPLLTFRFVIQGGSKAPSISFIAPKAIFKKAVSRNSIRRRGYNVLRKCIHQFPAGITGVFVFKKSTASIDEIKEGVESILAKL